MIDLKIWPQQGNQSLHHRYDKFLIFNLGDRSFKCLSSTKFKFLSPTNGVNIHLSIDIIIAYYMTIKIKHISLLTVIEPLKLGSQAPRGIIHRRHE